MTAIRRELGDLVSGRRGINVIAEMPGWYDDALCAETDPEIFYPEKGGSTREAKSICASCTVRDQCLEWALDNGERWGIWGGLAERDRRKLEKARRTAA